MNPTEHLRSLHHDHPIHVNFINKTERFVNIIWIDYEGKWIRYSKIPPGNLFQVSTYLSHPWVFIDDQTKCRLMAVGRGDVFCPLVMDEGSKVELPIHISITIPLLSLREKCLQVLCRLAFDKNVFERLNLCSFIVKQLQEYYDIQFEYDHVMDLANVVATCEPPSDVF